MSGIHRPPCSVVAAVITGDLAHNEVHVMTAETGEAERAQWIANFDMVAAPEPAFGMFESPQPAAHLGNGPRQRSLIGAEMSVQGAIVLATGTNGGRGRSLVVAS
jgi:hypothetical protein